MRSTIRILVLVFLFDVYVRTMVEELNEREVCNTYVVRIFSGESFLPNTTSGAEVSRRQEECDRFDGA